MLKVIELGKYEYHVEEEEEPLIQSTNIADPVKNTVHISVDSV